MSDQLLSVILLCRADEFERIPEYVTRAVAAIPRSFDQFEVVVLQDGGPALGPDAIDRLTRTPGVRYICLSHGQGLEKAIGLGLQLAIGDVCVTMSPKTDPMDKLVNFIERQRQFGGLVIGQRLHPEREGGIFYSLCKRAFHFLAYRLLGHHFPKHTTFMVCLDRAVLNSINQTGDRVRFFRAITSYIGVPVDTITYSVDGPLRSFWEAVNLSIEVLIMNSTRPLRVMSVFSLGFSLANLSYVAYVLAVYLRLSDVAPGWTTLSLQVSIGMFLLFMILAVFSEYIHRLLAEVRDRPDYMIVRDVRSQIPVNNADRRNVTEHS